MDGLNFVKKNRMPNRKKIALFFKFFRKFILERYLKGVEIMENLREKIGGLLRKARGKRTLFEAAGIIGMTDRRISSIEHGRLNVTLRTIEKICNAYDVELEINLKIKN